MTSFISSMCLSFCLCLPVSFSLTAPLNQLMRCLRKYQSRTPSPLLHSVPSEIVFDFEPGPVFRGSWALLSCFHPNKISKTTDAVCASPSHRVYVSVWVYQNTSVFLLGLAGMLWMCFSHILTFTFTRLKIIINEAWLKSSKARNFVVEVFLWTVT